MISICTVSKTEIHPNYFCHKEHQIILYVMVANADLEKPLIFAPLFLGVQHLKSSLESAGTTFTSILNIVKFEGIIELYARTSISWRTYDKFSFKEKENLTWI